MSQEHQDPGSETKVLLIHGTAHLDSVKVLAQDLEGQTFFNWHSLGDDESALQRSARLGGTGKVSIIAGSSLFSRFYSKRDSRSLRTRATIAYAEKVDRFVRALSSLDVPRLWTLFSLILSKKTRETIFEPTYNEFLEDYTLRKRYRTKWAKRWIAFAFTVRTVQMICQCLGAQFGNWLTKLFPWLLALARWLV